MILSSHPSAVRVFGKSMHALSAGWAASVAWLWIAEIQQHILRQGVAPPRYAVNTILSGLVPALLMACLGLIINRWTGPAPDAALQRREWWHAVWWSAVPNLMLLVTVWVMLQEAK